VHEFPFTPPTAPVDSDDDWQAVERRLGCKLPGDYKQLVTQFGLGGAFGYIWFLNPFTANEHLNLVSAMERERNYQAERLKFEAKDWWPHTVFPEKNGLLGWGVTDNGDTCYWLTAGPPSKWHVVIKASRGGSEGFELFRCGLARFLALLAAGTVQPRAFPDDYKAVRGFVQPGGRDPSYDR
jgi:hypothetical protein